MPIQKGIMMLIKSMTGYGRAVETVGDREFSVELRSVNNRYLDCSVKLPRALAFAEDAVKQQIKTLVSRGKIDVFIACSSVAAESIQISLNRPILEGYLQAMRAMVREYGVSDDISVSTLSRLPELYQMQRPEEDEEQVTADLIQVLERALAAFDAMRAAEGAAMDADLRRRIGTLLQHIAEIEAGSAQTVADYRARLEAKMREVLENTALDESRILTEAAIFADRVAVDEETVRLRSHLAQMEAMLDGGGPIGRKLDFLLQEMNRETNTIGSKCTDLRQTRIVVDMKAELEKIREQTQNIE